MLKPKKLQGHGKESAHPLIGNIREQDENSGEQCENNGGSWQEGASEERTRRSRARAGAKAASGNCCLVLADVTALSPSSSSSLSSLALFSCVLF